MTLRIASGATEIRLVVCGDIDNAGAEALKTAVAGLSLTGKTEVIFDFRDVNYIGSAGLGKLLLFYKRLSAENVQMRIASAPPAIAALLRELRLDTLFSLV